MPTMSIALLDRVTPFAMHLVALLQPAPYAPAGGGGGAAAAPAAGGGGGGAAAQGPGGILSSMLFPVAIFVFFYFFIIRPQGKKQKEQEAFQKGISKGDRVLTTSGMIGTVSEVKGNVMTLQLAEKVFVKFTRDAVRSRVNEDGEPVDADGKALKPADAKA